MVKELLMERVGVSAETASRLALLSDGSPGLALELSRKKAKEKSKAEDVLKLIFSKSLGDMELATEMDVMSRKMGREGILVLCGEMTSLIHDMRRAIAGSRPLAREIVPDVVGADDESYRRMEKLFLLCEKRMRANVSPSMAFSTAAVSSRKRGA